MREGKRTGLFGLALAAGVAIFLARPARAAGIDAQSIYQHKCAVCHGDDGNGDTMKGRKYKVKPVSEEIKKDSEAQMIQVVEKGKGANMDSFSDELKPEEIKAVVEYYRDLEKSEKSGK